MSQGTPLSWVKLAAFSAPALPVAALYTPLGIYLPPFYAMDMGLGLAIVGTVFMVGRLWDVVTDPLMGVISDRFPSRWGRRRHWMVISLPVLAIGLFLLMFPGWFNEGQPTAAYLLASLFILYAGSTLLCIAHLSWGAELSQEYHERSRIQGWRELFFLVGMVVVLIIPAVFEQTGHALSGELKVAWMGWFVLILLPICVALAVTSVGEVGLRPRAPLSLGRALKLVIANRFMPRILIADFFIALPGAVRSATFIFFMVSVIKEPEWAAIVMLSYFAAGPIAVPLWIRISRNMEKHKACALGVLLHVIVSACYLIPGEGDALLFAVLFFASGIVYAGVPFLLRSIVADVTDADRLETGQDRAGLFYSLIEMTRKVGGALGIGFGYVLLDWIGFVPGGANDPSTIDGLRYVYAFTPVVSELLVFWMLYTYPLDRRMHADFREKLAAKGE